MAAEDTPGSSEPDRPSGDAEDDAWRPEWDPRRRTTSQESPLPSRRRGVSRTGVLSGVLVVALVVGAAVLLFGGTDRPTPATPTTGTAPTTGSVTGTPAPDALAAAARVFDRVNAEAGAAPARQRSVLEEVVDPARRSEQQGCAAATTTVRLIPAWSAVRVAGDGHLIVPTLVRIFTGTRITGTDVALIDVTISAGQAALPALCVS